MKRPLPILAAWLLSGCIGAPVRDVIRLIPVPLEEGAPLVCQITAVTPRSPAATAGLQVGDQIREIDGKSYTEAVEFLKALNEAPARLRLTLVRKGREHHVAVQLAPQPPRLGIKCDIAGVQAVVEDESTKDRYIVVENRRGVTVMADAELDGKLVLVRLGVRNFTDAGVAVNPEGIAATDGAGTRLAPVVPNDARRYLGSEPQAVVKAAETEPLIPQTVPPEGVALGSVYFAEPAAYPFVVTADVDGRRFEFHFENRKVL